MSDRAMDAVKRLNPLPSELPVGPIESVWQRIHAIDQMPAPRRRRWARGPGILSLTLSAAVTLAIVAVMLVVVSHHRVPVGARPTSRPHPSASSSHTSSRPQHVDPAIVKAFPVFRRHRTASDAVPAGLSVGACGGEGAGNYSSCNVGRRYSRIGSTPPADAADGWRLTIYGHVHRLDVGQARRLRLPDGLGSEWLIPSGHWLCALLEGPRWQRYFVRMTCGTIGLILTRPPIRLPGYFLGSEQHGVMMAVEPATVTGATIEYPGGTEPAILHAGTLVACVGRGPYRLVQRRAHGGQLRPIDVGAYGTFKGTSCPELGVHIR